MPIMLLLARGTKQSMPLLSGDPYVWSYNQPSMTIRGHIKNGVAVPDGDVKLPEGAAVDIAVASQVPQRTLSQRFAEVIGVCSHLPEDMAENHDHYVHGKPRR